MPTFAEIQNMKVGIWDMRSGVSGTEVFDEEERIKSITAIAGLNNATITIDNRDPITIPSGNAITLNPDCTIMGTTIVFTDTTSYVVEFVTNNFYGSTRGNI